MVPIDVIRQVIIKGSCLGMKTIKCNSSCPCFYSKNKDLGCYPTGLDRDDLKPEYLDIFKKYNAIYAINELLEEK